MHVFKKYLILELLEIVFLSTNRTLSIPNKNIVGNY